jgi:hypothetical protein
MLKTIDLFVRECCLTAANARYPAVRTYLAYVRWALSNGVPVQDQFTFIDVLKRRGLAYAQDKDESWFHGLAVLPGYRVEAAESYD